MSDLLYLISEEGLPTFLVIIFLLSVGITAKWFAGYFNANLNNRLDTLDSEIREMQDEIVEHNNRLFSIVEKLISNQKNRNKIFNIANKNNINVTLIGKIISEKGIHFDSHLDMKNIKKFDHFS